MAGDTIDPLISAYIEVLLKPDSLKKAKEAIDGLISDLGKVKPAQIDLALSPQSKQTIETVRTLGKILRDISRGRPIQVVGAQAAAASMGRMVQAARQSTDELGRALELQFSSAERSLAKRIAASQLVLGNRQTSRVGFEDLMLARMTLNEQKKITREKQQQRDLALRQANEEAQRIAKQIALRAKNRGRRDDATVTPRDVEIAERYVAVQQRIRLAEAEAAKARSDFQNDAARATKAQLDSAKRLAGRSVVSLAQKMVDEQVAAGTRKDTAITMEDLRNAEFMQRLKQTRLDIEQEISAEQEKQRRDAEIELKIAKDRASTQVKRVAQDMANTSYETGQRSDRNVTIEDIRAAEAYVDRLGKIEQAVSETLQALKDEQAQVQANMRAWDEYNEQLLQQFRERTAAAEAERIAKERTDEAVNRRRFTRQERVRAQQIADDAYARGDRPETAAKVLRADLQAARAELQASRARAEADERAAQAQERRLQAIRKSLTAQQRAYADRIANEELLAGARTSATPTESDYRAAERGVTALNDLADAEERAAKAMELRLEALRRNLTLEERAIADRKAREAILAGEVRSSLKPNQADYDAAVLENVETKKKADEEERAARATAARLESVKRIVSAEARRMAQMRADLEFTSQKRATNQVNEADLLAAEDQVQENARVAASEKEKNDLIEEEAKAVEDAQKAWDGYFAKIKQKRIELDFRAQQKAIRDATNEAQRYAAKLASLKADRTQKALGALTSASQDLGFLFPQAQFVGNVTRLGVSFGKLGASIGRYAAASVKAGVTTAGLVTFLSGGVLTGVGVAAGAFAGLASAALNAATSLARIAFSSAVRGLQLLLAPTLALVNAFQKVLSYAPALSVALGIGLSRSLTQAAVEMERLRALFDSAFLGDAGAQFEAIRERANRMGLTFTEAAQPMARLAFAARSAGLEVSAIDKLFEGVSSAAVALKLDSEKLNRAFTAFEQILSKGKVSSEELRGQLAEAIPGIVPIVQRALGKTGQELDKLLEKGEITAQELVRALGPELQSAFEVASLANADSLTAQLARIQNGFAQLKATLGASIAPAFIKFQQSLLDIANSQPVLSFLESLVRRVAAFFDAIRSNVIVRSIGARLAEAFVELGPILDSITKKFLLILGAINGPIIIGLVRIAQVVLPKIDAFLTLIIKKLAAISGIDLFPISVFEGFFGRLLSLFDNMLARIELVPDALAAVFDSLKIRIFSYAGPILSFVGSLVSRVAVLITSGLSGVLWDAITGNTISGFSSKIADAKSQLEELRRLRALPDGDPQKGQGGQGRDNFGPEVRNAQLDAQIAIQTKAIAELEANRRAAVDAEAKKYADSTITLAKDAADAIKREFGNIKLDEATAEAIDKVDAVTREKFKAFFNSSIPGVESNTVQKLLDGASAIGDALATGSSKLAEAVSPLLTAGTAIGDSITKSLGPGGNALTSLLSSFATGGGLPLKTQLKAAGGAVSAFGGDILDGKSPFAALGTLLARLGKLREPLPDLRRQPETPVIETFKSQFLDAESIFQNMQAQETLKEQKRTNEELVALRNEVKRGNDFAMNAPRGLAVFSPNMRGALI